MSRDRGLFPFAKRLALASLLAALFVGSAAAVPVYNTSALLELTGSRTEHAGQLVTGDRYAPPETGDFTIAWVITPITGGFHYQYTFSGFVPGGRTGAPNISHVLLDLSDTCLSGTTLADPLCVTNATYTPPSSPSVAATVVPGTYNAGGPGNSNPGLPASITGVKFDSTPNAASGFVIAFDSNRTPVYEDIYLKGGNASFVYNAGLGNEATSTNILDFIAAPDTTFVPPTHVVPEPSTWLLLATGLVGLLGYGWRRQHLQS